MNDFTDSWNNSDPYEYFMGRWSRMMAPVFLDWLNMPGELSWLDLGCGTGALGSSVIHKCNPGKVTFMDSSPQFVQKTEETFNDKASFVTGDAGQIPCNDNSFDVVVSGLALNFFPDVSKAILEMKRVTKPGGVIAAYVWDYSGRMDFLRVFWNKAVELDEGARELDEGIRFPICNHYALATEFKASGLAGVHTSDLDINTNFNDFDDYWNPFLGKQGPAPGYVSTLNQQQAETLRKAIKTELHPRQDGTISLLARAIGVRGKNEK